MMHVLHTYNFRDNAWVGFIKIDENWETTDGSNASFLMSVLQIGDSTRTCSMVSSGQLQAKECTQNNRVVCQGQYEY